MKHLWINQLLNRLQNALDTDSTDLCGFHHVGHVWEVYPEFEEKGYFYRGHVFEQTIDGEVVRAILHDIGNQHLVYICEGIPEVMYQLIKESTL